MKYIIVLGWYKRHINKPTVHEMKLIIDAQRANIGAEQLKQIVAQKLGRNYPKKIDFRFFDISMGEMEDEQ